MKVIHFITSIDRTSGGTASYMQLLASQLKNYCELTIVAGKTSNPIDLGEVKVHFFDLKLRNWFSVKRGFEYLLKKEKPDLVHINGIWNPQTWLFQKVAQKLGIETVLSPHGMLEPYILKRNALKKKIALFLYQRKALKRTNYIHATADSELSQIRKLGFKQPAKIIPNGIDVSEIRVKNNWKPNHFQNILFLSRIHPKKGIEHLIDAISRIKSPNFKLLIAGGGELNYIETLKIRCKKNNVVNLVEFIGEVYGEKKWELYANSDLFVLPTYSENFGIVVAEALATGIPVITTTGTPWEELRSEKCGWWIDLSVDNLTSALAEATSMTTNELKKMGETGQKLIKKRYDIKAVCSQMNAFYSEIIRP